MKIKIYFIFLFLFQNLFSLKAISRTIIISDIDDTIRQTNVLNKVKAAKSILSLAPAFESLLTIYQQFKFYYAKSNIDFYYLSASPECIVPYVEWIQKRQLPHGDIFLRTCDTTWLKPKYAASFKLAKIIEIIKNNETHPEPLTKILLFGDNAEHDPAVYQAIKKQYSSLEIEIFIRDIRVEATVVDKQLPVRRLDAVNYFLTENDLLKYSIFDILSLEQKNKIRTNFKLGKLYPKYLYKNLAKRYEKELGIDDDEAVKKASVALLNNLRY